MTLVVAERRIEGHGTPADAWQRWLADNAPPSRTLDELVPQGRRAVIVAPHPDDEVVGTGGLIALLAARAREIVVVAVTDGEASHPDSTRWPPAALAVQRSRETVRALRALGASATTIERLRIADGAVSDSEDRLVPRLMSRLRATDAVFAPYHLDGHPDHEAVGRAARKAAARLGLPYREVPIWAWHWATPGTDRLPWHRAVRLVLDDGTRSAKRRALEAFVTQRQSDPSTGAPPVLPLSAIERWLRPDEIFFLA